MAKYKLTKDVVTGEELPFIILGEGAYIPKIQIIRIIKPTSLGLLKEILQIQPTK